MFIVYILQNKKLKITSIGFADDLNKAIAHLSEKHGKGRSVNFSIILQEKYKSQKDAMVRVKQLKNQYR